MKAGSARRVIGIDLGTTNASVAVLGGEQPVLIPIDGDVLMPSVVGLAPDGQILVGQRARNQRHLYPEQTISSVKRLMGEPVLIPLGEALYTPVQISAMILRRLRAAAEAHIGAPVSHAVITVPAYFSDAQRTATREAGAMAGLTVERVLNEPTAAALTERAVQAGHFLVYDIGGGTFDVSVVRVRDEITEVLASHGDTRLGGDDFDELVIEHLRTAFERKTGADLSNDLRAQARLARAAEAARIELSIVDVVQIMEPHLSKVNGVPVHLDLRLSRATLNALIEPLVARTMDSVAVALTEAGLVATALDHVLLVGGASQTPLISERLTARLGQAPQMSVDPTQAVCLGAGMQAARLSDVESAGILVDVTPFSFGTTALEVLDGKASRFSYVPVIHRNSALPCVRSKLFYTVAPGQSCVDVSIYQGEAVDARENLLLGAFEVEGLDPSADEGSPILFELAVDLNGILNVSVTEQRTGLNKAVVIKAAFRTLDDDSMRAAGMQINELMGLSEPSPRESVLETRSRPEPPLDLAKQDHVTWSAAVALLERADHMLPGMEAADEAEVRDLMAELEHNLGQADLVGVRATNTTLADVLFYLD